MPTPAVPVGPGAHLPSSLASVAEGFQRLSRRVLYNRIACAFDVFARRVAAKIRSGGGLWPCRGSLLAALKQGCFWLLGVEVRKYVRHDCVDFASSFTASPNCQRSYFDVGNTYNSCLAWSRVKPSKPLTAATAHEGGFTTAVRVPTGVKRVTRIRFCSPRSILRSEHTWFSSCCVVHASDDVPRDTR